MFSPSIPVSNASMSNNYPKEIEEKFERQFELQGVRI